MSRNLTSVFAERGDAPALVFPGRPAVSYASLAAGIARRSQAFEGGKKLVAIAAEHTEHAITTYLAASAMGHTVAMLPPAPCGGHDEAFELRFQPDILCRRVGARWTVTETRPEPGAARGALHPELALLLQTSGSTGGAKAVRLSRAAVDANAGAIAHYLGLGSADRGCLVLPLHYSYGLSVLHSHLHVGASLFLPQCSILDEAFAEGLAAQECTNFSGVPYSYELLEGIGFRQIRLPSLRLMTVAGGRLAPETVGLYNGHMRARGGAFFAMYGQTEATARIAYVPPGQLDGNEDRIGIAIPGGTLSLESETGEKLTRPGEVGELVYRGPNVMMGYAASRADLATGPQVPALRTGDLATVDENGLYRITGRIKRISKLAGRRIGHDMLEEQLGRQGIRSAVVGDDERVHAFYVGAHGRDAVRKALAAAGGLTLLQVEATPVDSLPRLASGKLDYGALKTRLGASRTGGEREAASVREAFDQVFYPRKAGPQDSFVSLGGDSLRYVQLSLALERILGEPPAKWETMSLNQLGTLRPGDPSPAIGVDLLIRALAIVLVVVQHQTLWPVPGGSAAMVVLVGFGLARFQAGALMAGDVARVLRLALPALVPYYLIVASYAVAWGEVPWASVLLLGNFGFADPVRHDMVPYLYWFIEAFCQMLLVVAALFSVPAVRRFTASDPYVAGLAFLALALAARLLVPLLEMGNRQIFTLPWIFYLAAFGWTAAFAGTLRRKLALAAIAVAVFTFFAYEGVWIGTRVKYLLQIAVLFGLLFCLRVPMPLWLKAAVLPVSAASFHIYVLHRFVPELVMAPIAAAVPSGVYSLLAIVGGVGLGLAAWRLQGRVLAWLAFEKGNGILARVRTYIDLRAQRPTRSA